MAGCTDQPSRHIFPAGKYDGNHSMFGTWRDSYHMRPCGVCQGVHIVCYTQYYLLLCDAQAAPFIEWLRTADEDEDDEDAEEEEGDE